MGTMLYTINVVCCHTTSTFRQNQWILTRGSSLNAVCSVESFERASIP